MRATTPPLGAAEALDAALAAAQDATDAQREAWLVETRQRWKTLRPRGSRVIGALAAHLRAQVSHTIINLLH